jgi:hypothetical protein
MAGIGARRRAVETAISREARQLAPPQTADGRALPASEQLGWAEFSLGELEDQLPIEVISHLRAVREGTAALLPEAAELVAAAAYRWARERGANHFCRWTSPCGDAPPEIHEAFLRPDGPRMVPGFSGAQLSGDASARWDPRAPMFLIDAPTGATLCIPCDLPDGAGLRAPLRESCDALVAVLAARHQARPVAALATTFLLIDEAYASLRPDLLRLGRALFGSAPKTRLRIDRIPPRALALLHEVSVALIQLGVPVRGHAATRSPAQFALLTSPEDAARAGDHDQLVQEALARIAPRHHLRHLTHPEPFPNIDRQSRQVTWWLQRPDGTNLADHSTGLRDRIRAAAESVGAQLDEDSGHVLLRVDGDTPVAGALAVLQRAVHRQLSETRATQSSSDDVLAAIGQQAPPSSRGRVRFQAAPAAAQKPDPNQELAASVLLELTQRVLLPTARAEPFFPDVLRETLTARCAALAELPGSKAAFDELQQAFIGAEEQIADERWPLPRAAEILLQGV